MVLLFDGDTDGLGPVGVAVEVAVPCGCIVVFILLLKLACCAVVGEANGVETMRGAVPPMMRSLVICSTIPPR